MLVNAPPSRASQRAHGKESACQCRRYKKRRLNPWVGKIPSSRKYATHSNILAMDRGDRRDTVHGVAKSWAQLSECLCACTRTHTHALTHTHPLPLFDREVLRGESRWEPEGEHCSVCLTLCDPWTVQSRGSSRPEYWSGQPFPSPGDLPDRGTAPRCPTLQAGSSPAEPPGKA